MSARIPRYVRVNLLKTSVEEVIQQLGQDGWKEIDMAVDNDRLVLHLHLCGPWCAKEVIQQQSKDGREELHGHGS